MSKHHIFGTYDIYIRNAIVGVVLITMANRIIHNNYFFKNNYMLNSKHQAWMDGPLWSKGFARKRPRNSYFKQIKPVLLLFRLLGRFPCDITEDGVKPFRMKSSSTVYTVLFYIACVGFSIKTMISLWEMVKDSQNYDHSLQLLMMMSCLIQNFLVPITYWQKSGQIVEYIALWSKYETEYNKEFNQLSCKKWIIYSSILLIPVSILYCLRMYIMIGVSMTHCLMFFIMAYASDLLTVLWVTTHYEIRQQAKKLCRIVSSEGIDKEAQRKRYCWLTLSLLTSSLGDTMGLATGSLMSSLFFSFLIGCYGRLTSFMDRIKRAEYVWWEFLESSIIYVYFFFVIDVAESTSYDVGKKFSSIILNLSPPKMDKPTFDEMSLLLSCVSAAPPTVSFGGFILVQRSLVTSFVSSSVTYLVMLFQYRRK